MSKELDTHKLSAETLQGEMKMASEDLEAVASLLVALGGTIAQGELRPEWLAFVGRGVEAIAENLADVAGRLA